MDTNVIRQTKTHVEILLSENRRVWLMVPPTTHGGDDMISYIYRLIQQFQRQHGIHPNLLYLNEIHAQHLKQSFGEDFSHHSITDLLQMELIINKEITHPHVAWTHTAQRMAV